MGYFPRYLSPRVPLAWIFAIASFLDAGEIEGRVTVTKGLTKRKVVVDAYQLRGAALGKAETAERPATELESVVVYLAGPGQAQGHTKYELVQRNRRFSAGLVGRAGRVQGIVSERRSHFS
jgi:hypothetical protein